MLVSTDRPPLCALRGVQQVSSSHLWTEKHVKLAVGHDGRTMVLKEFGIGDRAAELAGAGVPELAYEVERDGYYGRLG